MEPSAILIILMVISLCSALMLGYPVAFTLAGVALAFGLIGLFLVNVLGISVGTLDVGYIGLFPDRIFGNMMNEVLLAVPLFIAMGVLLEKTRVAEDLIEAMGQIFGHMRGGLGISITVVGALLAASTGIVGATVVTMGLLALPTMLRRGYDPALATGSIAAAGTLGQIIPPSIVLVILADVLSAAWQEAQRDMGIFAPTPLSVGDLFAGALLPGLLLVGLYILYQLGIAFLRPDAAPLVERDRDHGDARAMLGLVMSALMPPVGLIIAVLGSILWGIATPTEAAAVGAIGAAFLGARRLEAANRKLLGAGVLAIVGLFALALNMDIRGAITDGFSGIGIWLTAFALLAIFLRALGHALYRLYRTGVLDEVMMSTLSISTMVFTILIGATLFALVFRGLGGDFYIEDFLTDLPGGTMAAVALVMGVMFLLGFILDFIEITFIVVPIVAPVLLTLGIHPVWLGVMMAVNLQTSFLTPPFGFALFYLRSVAPESVKTRHIYRGAIPFVVIQIVALLLIALFPALATWLPNQIFGTP